MGSYSESMKISDSSFGHFLHTSEQMCLSRVPIWLLVTSGHAPQSVSFWTVCATTCWWWKPSPYHHWSYQKIMFFTASSETLTSVTCARCDSSFISEDNRAALLFVSHLKRVNPSSWSLGLNWLKCRSLEEVMIFWTTVWFVGFAAAGQVNSDFSSLEDNRDSSRASLPLTTVQMAIYMRRTP